MNMNEEYGGPVSNPDVQKAIRKALDYSGIRMICGDGTFNSIFYHSGRIYGEAREHAQMTTLTSKKAKQAVS